jgi:hypothetical protein
MFRYQGLKAKPFGLKAKSFALVSDALGFSQNPGKVIWKGTDTMGLYCKVRIRDCLALSLYRVLSRLELSSVVVNKSHCRR